MLGHSIRRTRFHRRLPLCRPSSLISNKELSSAAVPPPGASDGGGGGAAGSGKGGAQQVPRRSRSTKPASRFAYPEGMTAYEDDWVDEPEYPPIDPEIHTWHDRRRDRLQKILDWYATIKKASCPELKNLEINMPRQFGYKVFQIKEDHFDYDSQMAYKYLTRTHVASKNQLPSHYSSPELNEKVEYFKQKVKGPLLDALAFEMDSGRGCEEAFNEFSNTIDLKKSQTLVPQINRVILSVLGQEVDYLKDCHVDLTPRVEGFWLMGGQEPTKLVRSMRKGNIDRPKGHKFKARYIEKDDPVEEAMHYVGNPLLQVRCKDPPKNFLLPSDQLCQRSVEEFPDRFPHFLGGYGIRRTPDTEFRFASIIPGHWSGDVRRCNLMAFHPRDHLKLPERMGNKYWGAPEENEEALMSQAMLASFGRLVGQALYHGFDQFTDVEYPFSTQTVITNGLDWSFFAYQMNTMQFGKLHLAKNQKQNVIWGTQSQSIFDKEKKGELNDEVLSNLLRFYLNAPEKIQAENPTPYLGRRIQEDWEDERQRILVFWNFREQVSQRVYVTDNLLAYRPPEIYEWERIYKVNFNAMPLEPKRRFFELPSDLPWAQPWKHPYKMKDPIYESKGIRRLREFLRIKKEKEAIEESKKAGGISRPVVSTEPKLDTSRRAYYGKRKTTIDDF